MRLSTLHIALSLMFSMVMLSCQEGSRFGSDDVSMASDLYRKPDPDNSSINSEDASGIRREEVIEITPETSKIRYRPVHMLWAMDNSGSMGDDMAAVRAGIKDFTSALSLKKEEGSIQVTMITSVGNSGTHISAAILASAGVHVVPLSRHAREDLINVLIMYVTGYQNVKDEIAPQLSKFNLLSDHPSSDFLRSPEALKVFVIVTDEPDQTPMYKESPSVVF